MTRTHAVFEGHGERYRKRAKHHVVWKKKNLLLRLEPREESTQYPEKTSTLDVRTKKQQRAQTSTAAAIHCRSTPENYPTGVNCNTTTHLCPPLPSSVRDGPRILRVPVDCRTETAPRLQGTDCFGANLDNKKRIKISDTPSDAPNHAYTYKRRR